MRKLLPSAPALARPSGLMPPDHCKLTGMALPAAKNILTALDLGLEVRWVSRAETIENHVLSQRPSAGQKVSPRSTIEVVVNR